MKKKYKSIIKYLVGVVLGIVLVWMYYYLALPVLNVKSGSIYFPSIIILIIVGGLVGYSLKGKIINYYNKKGKIFSKNKADSKGKFHKINVYAEEKFTIGTTFAIGAVTAVSILILFCMIVGISGSKLFRSKEYYKQLTVVEESVDTFNTNFDLTQGDVKLPVIDKELAFKLAQARLSNYGAQYSINSENFTIISVNNELVRVTPLEYSGLFVSLSKMNEGSSGYIKVNVETMESELVLVDGGLKYMPTAKFKYDLTRHIRFNYPTLMFDEYNFEIDDNGKPYWVIPTYDNKISLFGGAEATGVIICDPVTGETNRYALGDEPEWVDRVVSGTIAEKQATNSLKYKNGFFNAHFGQKKEVFQVSDGYNYFIKDNHTYYVSCMTSPNEADQTSIGFIIVDLKTKESYKYFIDGITEMRCREIAMLDESVKAQQLDATWPILVSFNNTPTYFVVLKNEVQYQKLCLINVSDGSMVAMGNSLNEVIRKYEAILANKNNSTEETLTITGVVTAVRDLGDTIEFMISINENEYFVVNVDLSLVARFLSVGDNVTVSYNKYSSYNYVVEIVNN